MEQSPHSAIVDPTALDSIMLTPVDTSNGIVKPLLGQKVPLHAKLSKHQQTVVMVVRQPACPSCMEQASQLARLASTNVSVIGITKDSSNPFLLHFQRDYFCNHDMFVNDDWHIYRALGNEKVSIFTILRRAFPLLYRKIKNKLYSPVLFKGDFWLKGGILVFDRNGSLIHAEKEEFGLTLDLQKIRRAIEASKYTFQSNISRHQNDQSICCFVCDGETAIIEWSICSHHC